MGVGGGDANWWQPTAAYPADDKSGSMAATDATWWQAEEDASGEKSAKETAGALQPQQPAQRPPANLLGRPPGNVPKGYKQMVQWNGHLPAKPRPRAVASRPAVPAPKLGPAPPAAPPPKRILAMATLQRPQGPRPPPSVPPPHLLRTETHSGLPLLCHVDATKDSKLIAHFVEIKRRK